MPNRIKASLSELSNLSSIIMCGVLVALYVVIDSFSIYITPQNKLAISFIALALLSYRLGFIPAALAAVACDVIGFLIKPMGPYFPGFALSKVITVIIFAYFLYMRPVKLWRVALSKALVNILVNISLNTLWISVLYGKAYKVILLGQITKNLILLPVEIILLWLVLKGFEQVLMRLQRR